MVLINPHKKSNTYLYGMIFNAAAVNLYAFALKMFRNIMPKYKRETV